MSKTQRTVVGWVLFLSVSISFITFGVVTALRADRVAERKHDFKVVCEFQGGHIATLDEGQTFVCIKDGKVISRG